MKKNMFRKKQFSFFLLAKVMLILTILLVGFSIVTVSIEYFSPDFTNGYLSDKKDIFNGFFKYGLYVHIVVAPILLLLGSIQAFRKKKTDQFHRRAGFIYFLGVTILGGPSGVVLSFYAFGGIPGKFNFFLLSALWIYFTWKAFSSIKKRDKVTHKINSISSYVLLLSAILLRIFSFIVANYTEFSITPQTYVMISLLSWLPSLLAVQLILKPRQIKLG